MTNLTSRLSLLLLFAFLTAAHLKAQTWTDITANLPAAPKLGSGQSLASAGSDLFVISSPNGVLRSRDNGATWQAVNTVTGNANNLSTFGTRCLEATGTTIWAGGEPGSLSLTGGVLPLHRQTVPSDAWTPSFGGAVAPVAVDLIALDSSNGTLWCGGLASSVYKSTDGGNTWTEARGNLPSTSITSLLARNGRVIATVNNQGIFTSSDGGATWVSKVPALTAPGRLVAIGDQVSVIGEGSVATSTGTYFSSDFGDTWQFTQVDAAAGAKVLKNTCADATTMFAGGQLVYTPDFNFVRQATVAFSKNGGMTWDDLSATGLGAGIGKQVERLVRHGGFLFALTGENKLYRLDLNTVTLTPTLKVAVAPKPAKSLVGGTLTMKVLAGGPGTLTYQWKKGTADIPGQTTDTLTLTNVQTTDTGDYTCVVTAGASSVTTAVARGTVVERIEGRYDPTFDRTNMAGGDTGTPFLLADGSVVVGTSGGVYKLGPNGGKTDSRGIGGTTGYNVRLVDSSGRVLLGGIQGNSSTHRVRRLLGTAGFPDDTSFPQIATNSATNATIRGIRELTGSGYLVWGDFSQLGPAGGTLVTVPRVALVNFDGSLNTTFNTNIQTVIGLGASATPWPLPDGTAWIYTAGGVLTRVNSSGQKVAGHNDYTATTSTSTIHAAHVLSSGKLLVGLGSSSSRGLRLFNTNGTFDTAFNTANLTLSGPMSVAAEQADGKIVVAGSFTAYGSNTLNGRIMRINADGTFDSTFHTSTGFGITAGATGMAYDPRGYVYLLNESNNATTGGFQDAATMGDTIGRNVVRVFATAAPATGTSYASWQAGFTFPAGLGDAEDDADGDGLPNLLEYAFGSHPLNPSASQNPAAGAPVVVGPDEFPTVTFRRLAAATGVTFTVKASATPAFASDLGVTLVSTVDLGGGVEQVTYRSNASTVSQPKQFLRVSVTAP